MRIIATAKSNMKDTRDNRKLRMGLVIGAAAFILLIALLAKLVGDGPVVPAIFLIGCAVFFFVVVYFFANYRSKQK